MLQYGLIKNVFWLRETLVTGGVLLYIAAPVYADAYLDALRDAADGVSVDPLSKDGAEESRAPLEAASESEPQQKGDIPVGMKFGELEDYLKQGFIGSYAFFKRLNNVQKQRVFEAYESRPEITHIRDQIKQQYIQN